MGGTLDLVDGIYAAGVDATAWTTVLNALAAELGARDVSLYSAAAGDRQLTRAISGPVGDAVNGAYVRDFAHRDVQMLRLLAGEPSSPISGDDLLEDGELATCPVHEDFLAPNDLHHQVVWYLPTGDGERHTLAFSRRRRQAPFRGPEQQAIASFAGHVGRALASVARMTAVDDGDCAEALAEAGIGVFVQSPLSGMQAANGAARRLAEDRNVLALVRRCAGQCGRVPRRRLLDTARGRLDVETVSRGRRRFVFTRAVRYLDADTLRDRFGFTPAEAALARSLAEGSSVAAAAAARGVSVHTARNQLRAVFAKAGVTCQKDLVAVVMGNPSDNMLA